MKCLDEIRKFNEERDWDQFHTPENLAKSISIEAGELLEYSAGSEPLYPLERATLSAW